MMFVMWRVPCPVSILLFFVTLFVALRNCFLVSIYILCFELKYHWQKTLIVHLKTTEPCRYISLCSNSGHWWSICYMNLCSNKRNNWLLTCILSIFLGWTIHYQESDKVYIVCCKPISPPWWQFCQAIYNLPIFSVSVPNRKEMKCVTLITVSTISQTALCPDRILENSITKSIVMMSNLCCEFSRGCISPIGLLRSGLTFWHTKHLTTYWAISLCVFFH
jgi:hypothetical protein